MADGTGPAGPGLVTSAISTPETRHLELLGALDLSGLWQHAFPSAEMVGTAAASFPDTLQDGSIYRNGPGGVRYRDSREGGYPLLTIGPGLLHLHTKDWAKADRRAARDGDARERGTAQQEKQDDAEGGGLLDGPRGSVSEWSQRSRTNLRRKILSLDLGPLVGQEQIPCMVTLTLPADWLLFAPTAAHAAALVNRFTTRWDRKWGRPPQPADAPTDSLRLPAPQLVSSARASAPSRSDSVTAGRARQAVWKREFQGRGAPHWHIWTVPPTADRAAFRVWLSNTWNAVVFAYRAAGPLRPDEQGKHLRAGTGIDFAEGMRARDPKRLATYFLKESTAGAKAYQNRPPVEWDGQSCGRFWGVWGLEDATATVRLSPASYWRLLRIMKRLREKQLRPQRVRPERTDPATGEVRRRRRYVHRRGRIIHDGLWVAFNDAPSVAYRLSALVTA